MNTRWWSTALLLFAASGVLFVFGLGLCAGHILTLIARPSAALADGQDQISFRWGGEATRARRLFGPLDQGLLTVEILTQAGAQDGEYETLIQASWLSSDGSPPKKQVLFEGFGVAHATEFSVQLEARTLVLQFPTGRDGEYAEARWGWRRGHARFEREPQFSPSLRNVVALLDADRIPEARDALNHLILSSRSGVQFEEQRIFYQFLKATHRLARARYEAGARGEAAALVMSLLLTPPVTAPAIKPTSDDFVLCVSGGTWDTRDTSACAGGFNELPSDGPTASLLNDCAFLLQQGGHAHLAAPILRQVVASYPGHALARLNLADALWTLGEQQESRLHYRSFLNIYRGPGPIPRVPEHVLSRLAHTDTDANTDASPPTKATKAAASDFDDAHEASLRDDL